MVCFNDKDELLWKVRARRVRLQRPASFSFSCIRKINYVLHYVAKTLDASEEFKHLHRTLTNKKKHGKHF